MVPKPPKNTQIINKVEVLRKDAVVKMYNTCQKARQTYIQQDWELKKLLERVNLDRPILQKEKIKLILFEKGPVHANTA